MSAAPAQTFQTPQTSKIPTLAILTPGLILWSDLTSMTGLSQIEIALQSKRVTSSDGDNVFVLQGIGRGKSRPIAYMAWGIGENPAEVMVYAVMMCISPEPMIEFAQSLTAVDRCNS